MDGVYTSADAVSVCGFFSADTSASVLPIISISRERAWDWSPFKSPSKPPPQAVNAPEAQRRQAVVMRNFRMSGPMKWLNAAILRHSKNPSWN